MFSIVIEFLHRYLEYMGENHFHSTESKQQFMNDTIDFVIKIVENGKVD